MNNLIISGYGKMGKEIEKVARLKGWNILTTIDNQSEWKTKAGILKDGNVIIDFSMPEVVVENIKTAFTLNIPVIVGTTGWNAHFEDIKTLCKKEDRALIYASNFSIGVNIFFETNKYLAKIMNLQEDYEASLEEIHHTEKLDSPSGTAITLAQQIIEEIQRKKSFVNQPAESPSELQVISKRIPHVPGTHIIRYKSEIDEIEIRHTAKSRKGFAQGAVWAAEWILGKKGFFNFNDILFNKL